jgi:hypothetical protein
MGMPYRQADELAKAPLATIECWLRDGDRKRWVRALYVKAWLTLVIAAPLLAAGARAAAAIVVLLGATWGWVEIRGRRGARITMMVERGRVRIVKGNDAPLDLALEDLLEVQLDSKSVSKNLTVARADGVNTIFGMGSGHNIDIDIARIELVIAGEEPIFLSPDFISASLCAESLRTIRLFLRAHGWKPVDERTE